MDKQRAAVVLVPGPVGCPGLGAVVVAVEISRLLHLSLSDSHSSLCGLSMGDLMEVIQLGQVGIQVNWNERVEFLDQRVWLHRVSSGGGGHEECRREVFWLYPVGSHIFRDVYLGT